MWHTIVLFAALVAVVFTRDCVHRKSEYSGHHDGHYCVCNSTYCDTAPDVIKPNNPAKYILITSSKSGLRFNVTSGVYGKVDLNNVRPGKIIVYPEMRYQRIVGFGGAITDSAGFNIYSLSKEAADNLLKSYFDSNGIEYSLVRTPMGGTDFSWRPYNYLTKRNDTTLSSFSLQEEDYYYKIPVIKRAQQLRHGRIKFFVSPWSIPIWMKTVEKLGNEGSLRPEYRQLWADYFAKYFEEYRDLGIEFWGLTSQNEPVNYLYNTKIKNNLMRWTAEEEGYWIMNYLLPTMQKNGFGHVKIFVGDENRIVLPEWPQKIFENVTARKAISGVAIHWYFDFMKQYGPELLDAIKRQFPEKLLLYTEACLGIQIDQNSDPSVMLGSWDRGEKYATNIIETMRHWVSSWIDWNIALDINGGPTYVKNYIDSPIIVNETADEFYKQPMFYALGHFSKSFKVIACAELQNERVQSNNRYQRRTRRERGGGGGCWVSVAKSANAMTICLPALFPVETGIAADPATCSRMKRRSISDRTRANEF